MVKSVIFFDLFDTLTSVNRGYLEEYFDSEIDMLGDIGILKNSKMTIEEIVRRNPQLLEKHTIDEMTEFYKNVMRESLLNIDEDILTMLKCLKDNKYKLCIISDAAFVDISCYKESPLSKYFDNTIFSCNYGYVKPNKNLYLTAKSVMDNPDKCFFIGDGGHEELIGAKKVNMITIKAEWFICRPEYDNIDYIAKKPNDILNIIKNNY